MIRLVGAGPAGAGGRRKAAATPRCRFTAAALGTAVLLLMTMAGCAHLEMPDALVGRPSMNMDWGTASPDAADRGPHRMTGSRPFEWWYFDGHLDSGETFVGTFQVPSFTNGKPGVSFSLYTGDWQKQSYYEIVRPEDVRIAGSDVAIETPVGSARRQPDGSYRVQWRLGGIEADFTLAEEAPGWIPKGADGVNESFMEFFWAVHQGRNRVTGTLTQNGVSRSVSGVGYADHNWGTRPLNEITHRWVWGRIIADDFTVIYADVDYRRPGIESRPLYVAQGGRMLVGTGSPTIRQSDFVEHPDLKRFYPRQVAIEYAGEAVTVNLEIEARQLVESFDLLLATDWNPFSRWLVRTFIARPCYFRVLAHYRGTISVKGETTPLEGKCLYEIMEFD